MLIVPLVMQSQEDTPELTEIEIDATNNDVGNDTETNDNDEIEDIESENEEKKLLAEFMANQTTTRNNVHTCNLCQNSFKHVKWLQSHMKSHSNWMKVSCSFFHFK